MVDDQPITIRQRASMLRETIYHIEALNKSQWEYPPLQPGDNASSYVSMMADPTIHYCIEVLKGAILAQGWEVQPALGSRGSAAMAVELQKNLLDIDVESALNEGMDAIWRGFQPHEIKWRYGQRRYRLDNLIAVSHDQIAFLLDDRMRITAIKSRPMVHQEIQTIEAEKLWLHVHNPSRSRPAGESMLEPAFRAWTAKNRLLQFWGIALQRYGMPQWMLSIPANTPQARQTDILNTFYNGRLDGVYLIPQDVTATETQPSAWANLTFENSIEYQDNEMIKALLLYNTPQAANERTSGPEIIELARATSYRMLRISRELCSQFNRQVIQPLCMANWSAPPEICPTLALPIPDTSRIATLAAPIGTLIGAGVISPQEAADQLGLPEPGPGAQRDQPGASADNHQPS
jgi:phage gp29-like protein